MSIPWVSASVQSEAFKQVRSKTRQGLAGAQGEAPARSEQGRVRLCRSQFVARHQDLGLETQAPGSLAPPLSRGV